MISAPETRYGYLRLHGLTKDFGDASVVQDVEISVTRGELVAFLGPSGCGKTTTLRMIAGFVEPTSGTIHLDGERIDQLPSRARGTAMVFQDYALFPHMTVADNIGFGLRMRKVSRAERRRRVREVLDFVHLGEVGNKYPKQLSGGMQQRVALARAIVVEPRVLLLDEPLSNLDAKLRKQLRAELRELHERLGITTVFVTHDLEEAFSLADRVVVMNAGRIAQVGTPQEIFAHPESEFVADFVGHTNMVRGELVVGDDGHGRFRTNDLDLVIATSSELSGPGLYTVPPHLLHIDGGEDRPQADNAVQGVVRMAAFFGTSYGVLVDVADRRFECHVTAGAVPDDVLREGRRVWLHWDAWEGAYIAD